MSVTVLIVDDEPEILRLVARMLRKDGYDTLEAPSADKALDLLEAGGIDVLLTDVSMPGMSGLDLLERLRDRGDQTPTIMMSGAGTIEHAVRAVRLGALDFIEKPIRAERLAVTLDSCVRFCRLAAAHRRLQADAGVGTDLVGDSAPMKQLRQLIAKVAPSDGRVLILGENGTGKELIAAAIHGASGRRDEPFIKLNCSAVPRELVESELFGHEKGAFTGAVTTRKGRFELADGGTLFLDEIGDMPMEMQVKLLRVLQEGQLERVGGTKTFTVDVRVLAATNKDLEAMVDEGTFREDLYYRLNVVTIQAPPLRERSGDIPLLAAHFAAQTAARSRRQTLTITPEAMEVITAHEYPGNVRELQNLVERLGILADSDVITPGDVEAAMPTRRRADAAPGTLYRSGQRLADLVRDAEKQIIEEAIQAHDGNKSATARALGLERSHFHKKCRQLGVSD